MTDDTNTADTTDEQYDDYLPDSVRAGLREATIPLETTDPAAGTGADLAPVADRMADAAVVGLGETTHGTREFFQLKHRLLRELVVEHGVQAFAMEANLPEAMALHEYVVDGAGDPRESLAGVYFWTWQTESVLAMLEWLREFNRGRPREDRVEVYGFDAQYTQGAVERLREHLGRVDPGFRDAVAADLDAVDDEGEPPHEADGETIAARAAAADRVVDRLREHFAEHRDAHVAATSATAVDRAERYVDVLEQAVEYAVALDDLDTGADDDDGASDDDGADDGPDFDPAAMERVIRTRDGAMADNVAWLREHTGADTLVLWAHDAHVNRVEQARPDGEVTAPSLGRHLADRHGDEYYALGFSFARGAFQAMSEDADGEFALREQHLDGPLPGTFDAAMDALDAPLAVLDVRAATADDRVAEWLAAPRDQFRTGGTYDPSAPDAQRLEYVYADAFDGVCFVAETTRARPLDGVDAVPDGDGSEVEDEDAVVGDGGE